MNVLYNIIVHQVGHLPRVSKSSLIRTFQEVFGNENANKLYSVHKHKTTFNDNRNRIEEITF